MKKIFFYFIIIIFITLSWVFFYYFWNNVNYSFHKDIKYNVVYHPDFIPKSYTVKLSSAWFWNLVSDFYWISAVQYIWSNVMSSEYKKYLYLMLNLITDLNPYFTYTYQIWQLLLPSYNEAYENINREEQKKYDLQWLNLWLKWIKNVCDNNKIKLIQNETSLQKLWIENKYINPCKDPMIPYFLAYIYYWSFSDPINSAYYYKVASANKDAPTWSRIMAAIMQWKWWNRQKSILMFLSLAEIASNENDKWKDNLCTNIAKEFNQIFLKMFQNNVLITWKVLWNMEKIRLDKLSNFNNKTTLNNLCVDYINKAIRELNLMYLEEANKKFFYDKKINAQNSKELYDNKYIDYIPSDFQKMDNNYGIIYFFNEKTWNWDYKMWEI